jgi:LacI family transcriptional regulator
MATIKDVARLAGVGVGTVSRVISGKGPVSAASTAKVQAAIKTLDFRPSHIARSLATKSQGTIGVFVPDFGGSYYAEMLRVTDSVLRDVDRHMIVVNGRGHGGPRDQAIEAAEFLMQRECDGLLILSHHLRDEDFIDIKRQQPNLATLNRTVPELGDGCFAIDHEQGGRLAARALLERGHRKIAVIAGPEWAIDNRQRMDGFFSELKDAGISPRSVLKVSGDFSLASGQPAAQALLALGKPFTGLFVANDEMALSALYCLQNAGLRVPEDVSVIAYDDIEASAFTSPRLSTIHIPFGELVMSALNWLLDVCYGMERPVQREYAVGITLRESLRSLV